MLANMNAHLLRHHEITIGVLNQLAQASAHLSSWAEQAETDINGKYESPLGGKHGENCLNTLVDALRRALVLEAESGNLSKGEDKIAKREALYVALHAYFGVDARGSD